MARVRYNVPSLYHCGGLTLLPGMNQVEDELLAQVSEHPGFKARVSAGKIQILPALEATPDPHATHLADIALMADVKALKKLAKDKDADVADAATARLAEIDAAEKKPESEK